jgi:hypothetical protein
MNNNNLRNRHQQSESNQEQNETYSQNPKQKVKPSSNFGFYVFLFVIFIVPLFLIPIIPIVRLDFSTRAHYVKLEDSPKFEGALSENDGLKKSIKLLDRKIRGAETVIFENNKMYTGLLNGSLVEIDKLQNIEIVAHIGPKSDSSCS